MPSTGAQLRRFLRQARQAARALRVRAAFVDLTIAGTALAVVATAVAAWTLRGDAVLGALPWAGAVTAVLVVAMAWRAHARMTGSDTAMAERIARAPGPVARPPLPDDRDRAHRLLRHEIRGALELADALDAERAPPPGGQGSPSLAAHYVDAVEAKLRRADVDVAWALPRPRWRIRAAVALGLLVTATAGWWSGTLADGFGLVAAGLDARPPVPPRPVWSTLTLRLGYPEYTGRPPRTVPNPSGSLRAVAGTVIALEMTAREPAARGVVVVTRDGPTADEAIPPQIVELSATDDTGLHFGGEFTLQTSGAWTVVLFDDDDDELEEAARRSPALPLAIDPDRPPEVELAPLRADQREVRETDTVELSFTARDDFGLSTAKLVYQLPDGIAHELPIPESPADADSRTWRRRYRWDISQIPVSERSEVLYWVEVRDNDPGLGLTPLPNPPGKPTKSAIARLVVRDDEAEHAANIVKLRDIRDEAVDLLAARMTTRAFEGPSTATKTTPRLRSRATMARELLARNERLLAMIAEAVDALSMDALTRERDVGTLTEIHGRLLKLHREALTEHEAMPTGRELTHPEEVEAALVDLGKHNDAQITQLEDEIIRIDDLVDGQIIERLEGLVARLEATQRKIVELLEQLAGGDDSVRAQIEQLTQRRREDLRRIAEARAMLRSEVDEEFMNLDAFAVLERMRESGELQQMLDEGKVGEALEQARGELGEVQGLRDEVQDRLGNVTEAPQLSEEERKRMQLLRELSRLQDDEGTLRAQTRRSHEAWREAVSGQTATEADREAAREAARALREQLDEINDARLGRDARRGLDDAKDALQRLEKAGATPPEGGPPSPSALELSEMADDVTKGLAEAIAGAESAEREGKALRRAEKKADALRSRLSDALPKPADTLGAEDLAELEDLRKRQRGVRQRTKDLLGGELADPLPPQGRQALRRGERSMLEAADELDGRRPGSALSGENLAWDAIQEAIDSLRRGPPPPPPQSSGDASTEADRDRTLRDELIDAMKEKAPSGYDAPVKRYYEELLR